MQGVWVQSLAGEQDPTCSVAKKKNKTPTQNIKQKKYCNKFCKNCKTMVHVKKKKKKCISGRSLLCSRAYLHTASQHLTRGQGCTTVGPSSGSCLYQWGFQMRTWRCWLSLIMPQSLTFQWHFTVDFQIHFWSHRLNQELANCPPPPTNGPHPAYFCSWNSPHPLLPRFVYGCFPQNGTVE